MPSLNPPILFIVFCFLMSAISCSNEKKQSQFDLIETADGISITENNSPVLYYQRSEKVLNDSMRFSNFIHPLFTPGGDTLTEIFPDDHPFHRGVYWAWHQVFIDSLDAGDLWIMKNIRQSVDSASVHTADNNAVIKTLVSWFSPLYENNKSFLQERNSITIHPKENDIRKIDFEIQLHALTNNVRIGGSDDEKGYGGFCLRLRLPEQILFTSSGGKVVPQLLQVNSGKWMDFSRPSQILQDSIGIAILSHSSLPFFPAPWILRQSGSMQNIVFPGRNPIGLGKNPVILRYRLIVHSGGVSKINLNQLQREYENEN